MILRVLLQIFFNLCFNCCLFVLHFLHSYFMYERMGSLVFKYESVGSW